MIATYEANKIQINKHTYYATKLNFYFLFINFQCLRGVRYVGHTMVNGPRETKLIKRVTTLLTIEDFGWNPALHDPQKLAIIFTSRVATSASR